MSDDKPRKVEARKRCPMKPLVQLNTRGRGHEGGEVSQGFDIKFVSNADELRQIGRFRYSVYVEEMGRPQPSADHVQGTIFDDLDEGSYIIVAWLGEEVVGTVRVNFCGLSDIGPYKEWYEAERVAGDHWPVGTAVLTRLMVSPRHRGTMLNTRLSALAFQLGLANNIGCALMDCNAHLVNYFQRFGWRPEGSFSHPDYGEVVTHSLDLTDTNRLGAMQSPFLRVLRAGISSLPMDLADVSPVSADVLAEATHPYPPLRGRHPAPAA